MRRRELFKWAGALALCAAPGLARELRATQVPARSAAQAPPRLPSQVAGVRLPSSPLAQRAARFARASCPDYLFNHCMRTFVFGALRLQRRHLDYRADEAFVGAALHDLGLLAQFESPRGSFELDGADAAERWVRENHGTAAEGNRVWHEIVLHDGLWALTKRHGPEAMLVALGAAADVIGPDPADLDPREVDAVLGAFPRLQFKQRFTGLLVAHCQRKPDSQRGTWLEGVCRAHAARPAPDDAVERAIAAAGFAE
jgi:hypothetical protein